MRLGDVVWVVCVVALRFGNDWFVWWVGCRRDSLGLLGIADTSCETWVLRRGGSTGKEEVFGSIDAAWFCRKALRFV